MKCLVLFGAKDVHVPSVHYIRKLHHSLIDMKISIFFDMKVVPFFD
jgi:hypothetical protein